MRIWILVHKDQEKEEVKKLDIEKMKKGEPDIIQTPPDFPWDELREMDWDKLCELLDVYPWYDVEVIVSDWSKKEGVIHFSLR